MKSKIIKISAVIILLFACITIFMSTSVIFNLFGIREKEGNYVFFVVFVNFIAGFIYLVAAYGLFNRKWWATKILLFITVMLIVCLVCLLVYVYSGGIYEHKTITAMLFRIAITGLFSGVSWFYNSNKLK